MPTPTPNTLYYVHDPMCSWCHAFAPVWRQVKSQIADQVRVQYLVGGLAPDSNDPMPTDMQQKLQSIWRQIEVSVPGTQFNHDFWTRCKPRRSTYPACRAVLAAKKLAPNCEAAMIKAIQQAYYLEAQNPSDTDTLIAAAENIGLDGNAFKDHLLSADIEAEFQQQISLARMIGGNSFPSIIWVGTSAAISVAYDYNSAANTLKNIQVAISK